jgi:glycosyltransferase involved in cell wall biosynthesis
MKALAYVLEKFPAVTETFVLREVEELVDRGYALHIFAGAQADTGIDQSAFSKYRHIVHYRPRMLSLAALSSLLLIMSKYPKEYFSSLLMIVWKNRSAPWEMAKMLRSFPGAVHFAALVVDKDVGHVHAHFASMPSSVALIVSRLTGASFSFSAHARDIYVKPVMLIDKMEAARFIITCSEFNRNYLNRVSNGRFSGKLFRIYHGLDLARHSPPEGPARRYDAKRLGGTRLLSVGRLIPKKGFRHLIDACDILKRKGCEFSCTIIGEGILERQLMRTIESKGLGEVVTLRGFVRPQELIEYYRNADIFVLPCVVAENGDRDVLPNVVLEAMAMGVPVVATDLSAISEALDHGRTGLLVPEGDSARIAEAIETLMHDADLNRCIRAAARKKVEELFDIKKNIVPMVELFEAAAAR